MSMVKHNTSHRPSEQQLSAQPQSSVDSAIASSQEFVSNHPLSASLTVFGVGLGVGFAMAFMASGGGARDEQLTHKIGRRVLDKLSHAVPDGWWKSN